MALNGLTAKKGRVGGMKDTLWWKAKSDWGMLGSMCWNRSHEAEEDDDVERRNSRIGNLGGKVAWSE